MCTVRTRLYWATESPTPSRALAGVLRSRLAKDKPRLPHTFAQGQSKPRVLLYIQPLNSSAHPEQHRARFAVPNLQLPTSDKYRLWPVRQEGFYFIHIMALDVPGRG